MFILLHAHQVTTAEGNFCSVTNLASLKPMGRIKNPSESTDPIVYLNERDNRPEEPPGRRMENPEVIIVPDVANSPSCSASTPGNEQDFVGLTSPTYAAAFRCIGASCEAHCCGEWNIPVDGNTYDRYRQFPQEKLGSLVSQFVILNSPGQPEGPFATINLQTTSGLCAFFGEDHLCGIQKECGPQLLSSTCSIYLPRPQPTLSHLLALSSAILRPLPSCRIATTSRPRRRPNRRSDYAASLGWFFVITVVAYRAFA
jgi:hypothetical protein